MPKTGRSLVGMVAGFIPEWRPVFDRNGGRLHVGIRTDARKQARCTGWRRPQGNGGVAHHDDSCSATAGKTYGTGATRIRVNHAWGVCENRTPQRVRSTHDAMMSSDVRCSSRSIRSGAR
ncbi:MAG: hypothetical protein E5W94_29045, partial [Mesorhizobium sp.]